MDAPVVGTVVFKSSRDVRVETPEGVLLCSFRGRMRTLVAKVVAGDRVRVSAFGSGEGVLEQILPRRTELHRATAGGRNVLVAANVDRLLIVVAARDPRPRWALVDRMIVEAERDGIDPVLCLNKWDLVEGEPQEAAALEAILGLYRSLGYDAVAVSAATRRGLDRLEEGLRSRTTALGGHSGVGKSTLLNAIVPGLDLRTTGVNETTGKGRHTTSAVRLLALPSGGYAVDTPGFREFQPVSLPPAELGRHYREFREHIALCRFNDCLHTREPGCGVRSAVERGLIPKMRYDNYLQILSALAEGPRS